MKPFFRGIAVTLAAFLAMLMLLVFALSQVNTRNEQEQAVALREERESFGSRLAALSVGSAPVSAQLLDFLHRVDGGFDREEALAEILVADPGSVLEDGPVHAP